MLRSKKQGVGQGLRVGGPTDLFGLTGVRELNSIKKKTCAFVRATLVHSVRK